MLEAIDINGNPLIGVETGDVITLDDWVTVEFTGDYEVMERTITAPADGTMGQIELRLTQYNPNAPTDVSDDPGLSMLRSPASIYPLEPSRSTTPRGCSKRRRLELSTPQPGCSQSQPQIYP